MEKENLSNIIMNPTRMRIIQFLLLHKNATTAQIGEELNDISIASLYRQVKILEKNRLIKVVQENKIRGTVEKVYELNQEMPANGMPTMEQARQLVNGSLLTIMNEFNRYIDQNSVEEFQKGMVFLSTSTLLLSDEEFMEFTKRLGDVFNEVIYNKPGGGRKTRRITFISSPSEEA